MTAQELLCDLTQKGVRLLRQGERLHWQPARALNCREVDEIRKHKVELMRLLLAPPSPSGSQAGCSGALFEKDPNYHRDVETIESFLADQRRVGLLPNGEPLPMETLVLLYHREPQLPQREDYCLWVWSADGAARQTLAFPLGYYAENYVPNWAVFWAVFLMPATPFPPDWLAKRRQKMPQQ